MSTQVAPLVSGGRPGTWAAEVVRADKANLLKYRKELGARFRAAREARGLGLREFARMIGMVPARMSNVERASHGWCQNDAERIAIALDALNGNR